MKAIVHTQYGAPEKVLKLRDVDRPVPNDGEVLVGVCAASINGGDPNVVRGLPYAIRVMGFGLVTPKNKVLGDDIAGVVEAVGRNATQFQPGDEVFGFCSGGFAEYVSTTKDWLTPKPTNLTFEQAAAVPSSGVAALQGLRDQGRLRPGQTVLINGASGGVGTFAIQIAKALGGEVTAVCSTKNIERAQLLGADHVIDYTRESFTKTGKRYDLILDVALSQPLTDCRRALTTHGTYVLIGGGPHSGLLGSLPRYLKTRARSRFVSQTMSAFFATRAQADLNRVKELIEAGEVTPVIDKTFPLDQSARGVSYVDEGHARGKVVITV
jgi:NADPH:quinone reductase-like Zn-dependent oxidoreductase